MSDPSHHHGGPLDAPRHNPHSDYTHQANSHFGTPGLPPDQFAQFAAPPPEATPRPDFATQAVPPSETALLRKRMLFVAAAVIVVGAVLHLLKLAFAAMFGTAGVVLLLIVVAAVGGYFLYRTQRTADAQALEGQLAHTARIATTNLTARAQSLWNTGNAASSGTSSPPHAWQAQPAQPSNPATPYLQTGFPAPPARVPAGGGAISAVLLSPSLIVYAILYTATFSSVWQSWWLLNGLNVWFVLCVAARAASDSRRTPALLLAIAGTVLLGMSSSPAEWNLTVLLSTERTMEGFTYSEPPYDLLPWINRLPVLVAVLFVIAWSTARRNPGGWALGLIPAALLAWWSIWYSEQGMTTPPTWFTFWLLNVGVFVGGCLACLAADAMTRPRSPEIVNVPPPLPPRSRG